jgi:DNA-binding transcriptional MerR regulator
MALTISRLAAEAGVSADTVRYYERLGLLAAPARSPSGYRQYDPPVHRRLQFIKAAQHIGLRLADIKELLDIQDRGACPCGHTTGAVERRLAEVDAEISRLHTMRMELMALHERTRDCADASGSAWWGCTTGSQEGGEGSESDDLS